MILERLSLEQFRLIARAEIQLGPGINLFTGPNAQGKTTLLEAAGYLSTGRSIRTTRDSECIRHDAPREHAFAAAEGQVGLRGRRHTLRITLERSRKTVWQDGKVLPNLSRLWGLVHAVCFVPADLDIVQGPPSARRGVLDTLVGQTNPAFLGWLSAMKRALDSRGLLMRQGVSAGDLQYDAYEAALAENAVRVMKTREEMVRRLSRAVAEPLRRLSGESEVLTLNYGVGFPANTGLTPRHIAETPVPGLVTQLRHHWRAVRANDLERRQTCDGPHRDDMTFLVNGRDARAFASQGQVRSCVLALRLAELDLHSELCGDAPILLLDDVAGELDEQRASEFLAIVSEKNVQTLMTATEEPGWKLGTDSTRRFLLSAGTVIPASRT